jgi:hypothetical protein
MFGDASKMRSQRQQGVEPGWLACKVHCFRGHGLTGWSAAEAADGLMMLGLVGGEMGRCLGMVQCGGVVGGAGLGCTSTSALKQPLQTAVCELDVNAA